MSSEEVSPGQSDPKTEKDTIDPEKQNYQRLVNEFNSLVDSYKATDSKRMEAERTLNEVRQENVRLQQGLAHETDNCVALKKDNVLLRAQIAEMSSAQEPLREEKYYVLEFCQIGMDVDSWAAKETRTMSKKPLSEADCNQLFSELYKSGEHGKKAAEGFEAKTKIFQERRNRIVLIRHVIAVILFDRIFDVFTFGLKREYAEYFKHIEAQICRNGFMLYDIKLICLENYSLTKTLTIRQAIGRATINAQAKHVAAFRSSVIQTLVHLLQLLLPTTPPETIHNFVTKVVDKSISLRTAMTEEQAVYRCYFSDHGERYDDNWMEVASGENPVGKVTMCTFPGLRRFTLKNGKKEFVTVVKATVKLDTVS